MWFGRPRGRDPAVAEPGSSAVIVRCHFCRIKSVQVCVQLTGPHSQLHDLATL